MKSIYKTLVMVVLYVVSSNITAQEEIFNPIPLPPFPEIPVETGTFFDCECFFFEDMRRMNDALIALDEHLIQTWLANKQAIFKVQIEKRLGMTDFPFASFEVAQREFFRASSAKQTANSILDDLQKTIASWETGIALEKDKTFYQQATVQKLVEYNTQETPEKLGGLKMGGRYLKDIPNHEAIPLLEAINYKRTVHDTQLTNASKVLSGIPIVRQTKALEEEILDGYMAHYSGYDAQNRVLVMGKYLIWQNRGVSYDVNNATYPFMYNTKHYNFKEVGNTLALNVGIPTAVTYPQVTHEQAIANYAFSTYGDAEYDYINNPEHSVLKNRSIDYLWYHQYSSAALEMQDTLLGSFASNTPLPDNQQNYGSGQGVSYQNENSKNLAFSVTRAKAGNEKHYGIDNMLSAYQALPNHNPEIVGAVISEMAKDNLINIGDHFSNAELASLFEFKPNQVYNAGPNFSTRLYFRNNLGTVLWDNGVQLFEMLDRPYVIEGVRALLNGEQFDFAFRAMVYDLSTELGLSLALKDWLKNNRTRAEAANQHLIANDHSEWSQTEATIDIATGATATPWSASSGTFVGNENFRYNAVRTWTYKDGQQVKEFRLDNGDFVARGNYAVVPYSSESNDVTWYRPNGSMEWFHAVIDLPPSTSANPVAFVIDKFWDGAKWTGRWIVPVEDVVIMLGGRDFDGNYANQYLAGGMLVVSLVPGGRLLKPITRLVGNSGVVRVLVRMGDDVFLHIATRIEDLVTIIRRSELPNSLISTFLDGAYRTVKTKTDVVLHRAFGHRANLNGGFATTVEGASRESLALLDEWNNNMRFEAKIKVPKDTKLEIGIVGPQTSSDGAQFLSGGGDQIILPREWDYLNWVTEVKDVTTGIKYTIEEFIEAFPNLIN